MWLQEVRLINFEAHEKLSLLFSEGVNLLAGSSDIGKSSIMRALYWVVFNRPSGSGMCRVGALEPTQVSLVLSNGCVVERLRSRDGSTNKYKVNDKELTGFGAEVPDDVLSALSLSGLNIQMQFDSAFLINQSPGQVADYLAAVVDLDMVRLSQAECAKRIRSAKQQTEVLQSLVEQYQDQLAGLQPVVMAKAAFSALEQTLLPIQQEETLRADCILRLVEESKSINRLLVPLEETLSKIDISPLEKLTVIQRQEEEKLTRRLGPLLWELQQDEEQMEKLEMELEQFRTSYQDLFPDECPLCGAKKSHD